ncbi:MAG: nucleotidyltransferase domain-containing protein [Nitrospirae bacterium]|nr:nucleotidyltransferase domain-containing protein [Nitrospirota bacterium]
MKLLVEHKTVTDIEKSILTRCRDIMKKIDPSADVILYGSRARGDAQNDSDYDLLVLTENEASLLYEDKIRRLIFPVELETGAVLTLMLINRHEWNSPLQQASPFSQNVEREGVIL